MVLLYFFGGEHMAQRDTNPYPNSDSNKRYYTYDYWLRRTFGGKCMKIPIDAGFTCPNIDGRCGLGGCIYCSGRGSGDFAQLPCVPVVEQFCRVRDQLSSKWRVERYIPYFQAHTNTYAPLSVIKEKIEPVMALDGVVGLNIATRADCLEEDVVEYLAELSERTCLTVELGLQSVHDSTAQIINRGHSFEQFINGYEKLRRASKRINICVHLIFGLPSETEDMMLDSVRVLAAMRPDQVKLHLLHIVRGTRMAEMYESGEYVPMTRDEYVDAVVSAICHLPPDCVVCRLTGDGMQSELLSPDWSRKKTIVINEIDKKLYRENLYQGIYFGGDTE